MSVHGPGDRSEQEEGSSGAAAGHRVSLEDERSADDRDEGWGERAGDGGRSERDDEWYLQERPPHWD